jgi:hypothetical protein
MTCREKADAETSATVACIYRATLSRLELYLGRVQGGLDLEAALAFAQYVLWSDLPRLCQIHSSRRFPKVDGAHLRWTAEELQRSVREWWTQPGKTPQIKETQMQQIRRNLDLIAGMLMSGRCPTPPK